MTYDVLRTRLISRLSSLPEVLFSFTKHWLILTVCLIVGATVTVAKVSTDSVIYEGTAVLLLDTDEQDNYEQGKGRPVRERNAKTVFASRARMLTSDPVLRKIVEDLEPRYVLLQDENPEKEGYGTARRFVSDVKEKISRLVSYLEHPSILDRGQEYEIQKAVTSLRKRLRVAADQNSNTLALHVYGNDRARVRRELDYWIDAYLNRLGGVADQWRETVLGSRTRFWVRREKRALDKLEEYQRDNPGVSKSAKNLLFQEVWQYQLRKSEITRALSAGGVSVPALPTTPVVEDSDIQWLLQEKLRYEKELIRVLPLYGENSDQVRNIKGSIDLLDQKLRGIDPDVMADPVDRVAVLKDNLQRVGTTVATTMKLYSELEDKLKTLEDLEEEYKRAREARQEYELWNALDRDDSEFVAAQVLERPRVQWTPYQTYPYRQVFYASLGSLGFGMVMALLFEILSGKVRFKNDIVTEFEVPVVGVIPRK